MSLVLFGSLSVAFVGLMVVLKGIAGVKKNRYRSSLRKNLVVNANSAHADTFDYNDDADVVLGLKEKPADTLPLVQEKKPPVREERIANNLSVKPARSNLSAPVPPSNKITIPDDKVVAPNPNQPMPAVIVLHLLAPQQQPYNGYELVQALLGVGLKHDNKRNIFNYYGQNPSEDALLFGIASVLEPGTFDIAKMGGYICPGLVFFLLPPKLQNPHAAVEKMLEVIYLLAEDLGGEVLDEHKKTLTPEKISDLRASITQQPLVLA